MRHAGDVKSPSQKLVPIFHKLIIRTMYHVFKGWNYPLPHNETIVTIRPTHTSFFPLR